MRITYLFISLCFLFNLPNVSLAQINSAQTINFSTTDNTNLGSIVNDGEGGSTDITGVQIDIFEIDASGNPTGNDLIYNANDIGFGGVIEEGLSISTDPSLTSWRGISIKTNDGSEFDFNGFESWEFSFAMTVTFTVEGFKDGVSTGSVTTTSAMGDRQEHAASEFSDAIFGEVDEVRIMSDVDFYGTFDVFLLGAATQPNSAPTFTAFSGSVETTTEDTGVEISFADLAAVGDEADADGFVEQFAVQSVTSGTLTIIGAPYDPVFNFLINADFTATWTPPAGQTGTLNAFTVKAVDNQGAESSTAVQATVTVNSAAAAPTVTTSLATSLTATTATLNGDVTSDGNETITERGFVYAKTSDDASPTVAEANGTTVIKVTVSGTTGTFNSDLTGLTAGTSYSVIAYATNSEGTTEGSVQTFTTSDPTIQFATTSSSGLESVSSANIQVNLSTVSTKTITVDYTVTGTATGGGTDYSLADGTLTINEGESSQNITIASIVDDAIPEADETVIITLSSPVNASLGTNTVFTYTITENDQNNISIDDQTITESESTQTMTFTVSLSSPSVGTTTVDYATSDGTAVVGGTIPDYVAASGTLTFNAGESSKTIDVTIGGDEQVELDETFNVTISNATGTAINIADATGTGTISNDDQAVVTLADVIVNEDDGTASLSFTVNLAVDGGFTVDVSTSDNTATTADSDYTAVISQTITFDGTSQGEVETVTVSLGADTKVEADEIIDVTMSNLVPVTVASGDIDITDSGTITITNDDAAAVTIANVSGNEDDGAITVTATLDNAVAGGFTVEVSTADGTATSGVDYAAVTGETLTFTGTAGETQTFTITPTSDSDIEDDETLTVSMSNLGATSLAVDITDGATITINNDDTAVLTIADVSGNEDDGAIDIIVTLDVEVPGGFTVDIGTTPGTARTDDQDYTAEVGRLTFAGTAGETQIFNITPTADTKLEANETFTVSMGDLAATSFPVDISDVATVTINNDDAAAVTIADVSGNEDDGAITVTATLDNAVQGGFTVDVNTADGTATTADGDYTALAIETLTFAGTAGETQTFTINPTSDTNLEVNETLTVSMNNLAATSLAVDITDGATITINNDDAAAVTITDVSGNEDDGSITVRATLNNAVAGGFTVDVSTADGSATTADGDYTAVASETLTFVGTAGETQTFTITPTSDLNIENDETLTVSMSNLGGTSLPVDISDEATITIVNDDFPKISFESSTSTGAENISSAQVPVSLSEAGLLEITVDYTVTGTATGGGIDYTLANGTLTFNASETSKNITIASIVNDLLDEDNETVIITLSNPANAILGASTIHTFTILDDDPAPSISFANTGSSGAESVSSANIQVNLSANSSKTVSIDYAVSGTATGNGTDFTLANGTLTFNTTEISKNITISNIVDDAILEENETVIVTLSNPINATLGTNTTHTYTILDNDNFAPEFTSTPITKVDKGANYNYEIATSDANGDEVTITAPTLPEWLTLKRTSGPYTVTTFAGTGSPGSNNGNGPSASFNLVGELALDASGNLYAADVENHLIRKITPSGEVTTFAGSGSPGFADGNGTSASFNYPGGLAIDASGNVYVADLFNHKIRKITPNGDVTTLAGSGLDGSDDGDALSATFSRPSAIAVDALGNVYEAGRQTDKIRKITPNGDVITIAGSGEVGSADGNGSSASFYAPSGIAVDAAGIIYVADTYNHLIRKITPNGDVTTIAGSGSKGSADGNGTSASFSDPWGIDIDAMGNIYVSDHANHKIRKITPNGDVTTIAGSGVQGSADGDAASASFNRPEGIVVDDSGVIYVSDILNYKIRKLIPSPDRYSISGNSTGYEGNHLVVLKADDGRGGITEQSFTINVNSAPEFTSTPTSEIGLKAAYNYGITTSDPDGDEVTVTAPTLPEWLSLQSSLSPYAVSTFAGLGYRASDDGNGTLAGFNLPTGVAIDDSGNIYVADSENQKIRKITPTGEVTTLAGSGSRGNSDGIGEAASFNNPSGVAVDASGNVYVADQINHSIRKITPNGHVTTLAGSGTRGKTDGNGLSASFQNPYGIASDASGNVYVADVINNRIRKITPNGDVTTLAGSSNGSADGNGSSASFKTPFGVAVDVSGNVYVADFGNHKIRKITPNGDVTTLAGSGSPGSADGNGTAASFNNPSGISVDAQGNVYVGDRGNNKIRKITPDGEVTTIAGSGSMGSADGDGTAASFYNPDGLAVDDNGYIYVADYRNHIIRKISPPTTIYSLAGTSPESNGDYDVVLKADDGRGGITEQSFTITILNEAPTDITLNVTQISENNTVNQKIGNFSSADPNTGDTHTYTLVSGTGDTDNGEFKIEAGALAANAVFNFEEKSSYSIRVRTTDAGNLTFEKSFTITIVDANDAPTAISTGSEASIIENSEVETVVTTFTTTDEDPGDTHTYTLVAGNGDTDNASFTIEGDALQVAEVFDFETKSSYSVRLRSTDSKGAFTELAITVEVTNEAEANIVRTGDVDFDLTALALTTSKTWTLTNSGDRATEVTLTSSSQVFEIGQSTVALAAGESKEVSISFTPTQAQEYQGTITLTYLIVGEKESQVPINISGTGTIVTAIEEPSFKEEDVEVYPNPVSGLLTINLDNIQVNKIDLSILAADGLGLWNRTDVKEKQVSLDVSHYISGLYILLISDGQSVVRKKVIIKH